MGNNPTFSTGDAAVVFDAQETGRVVATVIFASGPPGNDLIARASYGLQRLSLAPLVERDFTVSTPEELAPLIPHHLRHAIADLLLELAGDHLLRRRMALAYITLWRLGNGNNVTTSAVSSNSNSNSNSKVTERVARTLIGELPRHQQGGNSIPLTQERIVNNQEPVYRSPNEQARRIAPPVVDPLRARVTRMQAEMMEVISAVDRVVIGKREVIMRLLIAMAARGHVLFVDAPGVGKTLLCKTIAAAFGARFGRVQLTPDLMPMDVTGASIYDPRTGQFVFRPGPVFTNILLADEINRATPKTQSSLLEVMEERTVTVDGATHRMADPFQVLATMNPIDHDGTFPLPAAQIDRFMVMLELGYPTQEDEVRVLDTHLAASGPTEGAIIKPVLSAEAFVEWQRTVPLIHASPDVKRAAVAFVDGLRRGAPTGQHNVSPRATIAWMRAAQARAILAGREFVTVEDLLDIAPDVLRHRLWISAPEVRDRLRALGAHYAPAQQSHPAPVV